MGQSAFNGVTGECQGEVAACRITRYGNVLRYESNLADKILVCRDRVYDRSWEWVPPFRGNGTEPVVDR